MRSNTFTCDNCKKVITHTSELTTGYGTDRETGDKICFECCGLLDQQKIRSLKPGESLHFYFSKGRLINWPGTFELKPYAVTNGLHNIGRTRTDAWFKFNHNHYHGVQIGTNNECMKLTRLHK